jgi:hypothetical protein
VRKRPEIALVTTGAGYDLGPERPALPAGYADRVHAVLVRQATGQSWPTWEELMRSSSWNDYDGYRP